MMDTRKERRLKRKKDIVGTIERPRMVLFASSKHFYIQIINDIAGHTLAQLSTMDKIFKQKLNMQNISHFADVLYERMQKAEITKIVLDKNGFSYSGRLQLLADALRERGIIF